MPSHEILRTNANAVRRTAPATVLTVASIHVATRSSVPRISAFTFRYAAHQSAHTSIRAVVHAKRLLAIDTQVSRCTAALGRRVVGRVGAPATVLTGELLTLLTARPFISVVLALAPRPTVGLVVLDDLVDETDASVVAKLAIQTAVRLFANPSAARTVALLTVDMVLHTACLTATLFRLVVWCTFVVLLLRRAFDLVLVAWGGSFGSFLEV